MIFLKAIVNAHIGNANIFPKINGIPQIINHKIEKKTLPTIVKSSLYSADNGYI